MGACLRTMEDNYKTSSIVHTFEMLKSNSLITQESMISLKDSNRQHIYVHRPVVIGSHCKLSTKHKDSSDLRRSTGPSVNQRKRRELPLECISTPKPLRRQGMKISLINQATGTDKMGNVNSATKQKRSQTPKTIRFHSINQEEQKTFVRYDCLIEGMLSKCLSKKQIANEKLTKKQSKGNQFYLSALSKKTTSKIQ